MLKEEGKTQRKKTHESMTTTTESHHHPDHLTAVHEETHLLHHEETHHLHHQNSKTLGEDVPFYSRPRQRQRWNDKQVLPHVNWGDLFFDLFYVAGAYNLDELVEDDISWEGLYYFSACFIPLFMIWHERIFYDSRYAAEDNIFHRLLEILQTCALGTIVENIRTVDEMKDTANHSATFVFLLALAIHTVLLIFLHNDVRLYVLGGPEAKSNATLDITRKSLALLSYVIGATWAGCDFFLSDKTDDDDDDDAGNNFPILFGLLAFVLDRGYFLYHRLIYLPGRGISHKLVAVPMNLEFYLHRLGEWVMLMLGETVFSLVTVDESNGWNYYLTFYSGLLSVTMLQYLYFRSQPFTADDHAMRRSIWGGTNFIHCLLIYSGSLILVGTSYKAILEVYIQAQEGDSTTTSSHPLTGQSKLVANLFSCSLATSFLFLSLITICHRGWKANLSRLRIDGRCSIIPTLVVIFDLGLVATTATLTFWVPSLEWLSALGLLLVLMQVLLRTIGLRHFPTSKKAMESACSGTWPTPSTATTTTSTSET